MLLNTYGTSRSDIQAAAAIPNIHEVLLEPMLLARQGRLTQRQLFALAKDASHAGLNPVLVWDILMTENAFGTISDRIQDWDLDQFSAVRVSDVGAAQWLAERYPNLLSWCDLFQSTLSRLILSIELPEEKLARYCQTLPVDCELLGAGRILLFYSPRSLLTPAIQEKPSDLIEAQIQTEEYGNRRFPIQESLHGTMMYLDQDQFLLNQLDALKDCGFHAIRVDTRHFTAQDRQCLPLAKICALAEQNPKHLQQSWPYPVRAPFFKANRTTAFFPRLKSKLSPLRDTNCLAECIGSKNGEYGIFRTLHPFDRTHVKQMILPTKVAVDIPKDVTFQTISGEALGRCGPNQTIIMSWIKRTASGSILVK